MGAKVGTIAMVATCLMACAPEGPTAIVVGSLLPDDACVVSPESTFLLRGTFDASLGGGECTASYAMAVLVNSYLIRRGSPLGSPPPASAEPNVLQITRAEVSLLQVNDTLFPFGTNTPDPADDLPNPFSVTTYATVKPAEGGDPGEGVALVEVIPSFYKSYLMALGSTRGTLVAAIKLFGETTGGVTIEFAEYRFPIQICSGCLTICRNSFEPADLDDLLDGTCRDNSASDGRPCIRENCVP